MQKDKYHLRGGLFAVAVDEIFQLREVQGLIVYASDEIAPTCVKREESMFHSATSRLLSGKDLMRS